MSALSALTGKSLISLKDWTRSEIELVLQTADVMAEAIGLDGDGQPQPLAPMDRIMAVLFFEPSTRTRLSFEAAMLRLGGEVIGFASGDVSSAAKGESLDDTARVVGGYCDLLVIRHPLMGAAKVAADFSGVPVINAGDGPHEHPTQTLTDLFAIKRAKGRLDGLVVGLCGDLKYGRTVHSLAPTLARLGSRVVCIAPDELQMPRHVIQEVEQLGGEAAALTDDLAGALPDLDVLYMTRIQKERFPDMASYERVRSVYVLTPELMDRAPGEMIVLHPLPRVDEISPAVDGDERAWYFKQARGGVPVRMALIALILGIEPQEQCGRKYGLDVVTAHRAAAAEELEEPLRRELVADGPGCRAPGCVTARWPHLPPHALRLADGRLVCAYCERPVGER